jgi:peptidoglycan/LPS O-acetylase OafA/YrhL
VVFFETILALMITIVVSLISYRFFEAPFLKLKDKFGFTQEKQTAKT